MPRQADETRAAIVRAAQEAGVDPATALAFAERESSFNPQARSSKTIRGLFQMRGDLRQQYGVGDSGDAYAQAKGFMPFFKDTQGTMSKALGRPVTDAETYAGHHFGAGRAARMFQMDPQTPVDQVFTRNERAQNPRFDKEGTVGNLLSSVTGDIDALRAKFGGDLDTSGFEEAGAPPSKPEALDLSGFEPVDNATTMPSHTASAQPALDLSQFEPA